MNSRSIRKKAEFREFLKIIKGGTTAHWVQVAEVLGVDNDTITSWKKTPEAQEAIAEGIQRAMEEMETVGRKDWRMWREKLKMLGLSEPEQFETQVQINVLQAIVDKYGGSEGKVYEVPRVEEIEGGSSQGST